MTRAGTVTYTASSIYPLNDLFYDVARLSAAFGYARLNSLAWLLSVVSLARIYLLHVRAISHGVPFLRGSSKKINRNAARAIASKSKSKAKEKKKEKKGKWRATTSRSLRPSRDCGISRTNWEFTRSRPRKRANLGKFPLLFLQRCRVCARAHDYSTNRTNGATVDKIERNDLRAKKYNARIRQFASTWSYRCAAVSIEAVPFLSARTVSRINKC